MGKEHIWGRMKNCSLSNSRWCVISRVGLYANISGTQLNRFKALGNLYHLWRIVVKEEEPSMWH